MADISGLLYSELGFLILTKKSKIWYQEQMLFVYLNRRFLNDVFKIGLNHGLFGGGKQLINVFYVHGNCNSILYLQVSYEGAC